jgi:hypothetical protein
MKQSQVERMIKASTRRMKTLTEKDDNINLTVISKAQREFEGQVKLLNAMIDILEMKVNKRKETEQMFEEGRQMLEEGNKFTEECNKFMHGTLSRTDIEKLNKKENTLRRKRNDLIERMKRLKTMAVGQDTK